MHFDLTQSRPRPARYGLSLRFDTTPSSAMVQAALKKSPPSAS
jgi:hypothetical protein